MKKNKMIIRKWPHETTGSKEKACKHQNISRSTRFRTLAWIRQIQQNPVFKNS